MFPYPDAKMAVILHPSEPCMCCPPEGSGLSDSWLFEIVATETAESDKIAKTTLG